MTDNNENCKENKIQPHGSIPYSNDDDVVFIPPEYIKAIERTLDDWMVVRQLWSGNI